MGCQGWKRYTNGKQNTCQIHQGLRAYQRSACFSCLKGLGADIRLSTTILPTIPEKLIARWLAFSTHISNCTWRIPPCFCFFKASAITCFAHFREHLCRQHWQWQTIVGWTFSQVSSQLGNPHHRLTGRETDLGRGKRLARYRCILNWNPVWIELIQKHDYFSVAMPADSRCVKTLRLWLKLCLKLCAQDCEKGAGGQLLGNWTELKTFRGRFWAFFRTFRFVFRFAFRFEIKTFSRQFRSAEVPP